MPWEVAEKAVRTYAACGIREVIPSTMGEPLLYSHFENLVRLVQELGLKLNVTTNGSFPKKGALAWAQELLPVSADIKVSCWGTSQKSFDILCPDVSFSTYLQNLKTLAEERQKLLPGSAENLSRLSLQMAVCKTNREDVERAVELAAELGFDRVKLNRAVFLSHSKALKEREELPPEDYLDRRALERLPVKLEGTFLYPATEAPRLECCPFFGRELWILPDGSTEPCPDPGNRFEGLPQGKNRCEICHLFPKRFFSPDSN